MSQDYSTNYVNKSLQRYSDVDILSTQGRIGRKRYFVYSSVIPVLIFWAIATAASITSFLPFESTNLFYAIISIAIFAMMISAVHLTIQRCHDFNQSGYLAILAIIPLANALFALIPGTNGINQYGELPKPSSKIFKITFYALVLILIALGAFLIVKIINNQISITLFS